MIKFFMSTPDIAVSTMFINAGYQMTIQAEEADLFVFSGGHDVTPALYGALNRASHNCLQRDLTDISTYLFATEYSAALVGICRGGQFLNVMNGGSMRQDVTGHAIRGTHTLDWRGEKYKVTSTHHQMMIPARHGRLEGFGEVEDCIDNTFLSAERRVRSVLRDDQAEIVFYPKTKSLCFQPHPEYGGKDDTRTLFFTVLKDAFGI